MLPILNANEMELPKSYQEWLSQLHEPCVIEIRGEEKNQWHIVTTLIHGNEPSGFIATFELLKLGVKPKVSLAIVVASVRAARQEPVFTHRYIAGEYDLNRRFGRRESHDRVTDLANKITDYIRDKKPNLVFDLHNTSGEGPAFAVSISDHESVKKMASLFSERMVVTQLVVGSLMEQNFNCPVVTIECGGAQQKKSHEVALAGLKKIRDLNSLDDVEDRVSVSYHPTRIVVKKGISIDYGSEQNSDVDITLFNDVEALNSRVIKKGDKLAWLGRCIEDCLQAVNENGVDTIHELFKLEINHLVANQDLKIFMATKRADIALSDCLFYVVKLP